MVTKVIDAHPEVAILMENIFGNRRRHWRRARCWQSPNKLYAEVAATYQRLNERIVGNKVCTPDVWSVHDIALFCRLFRDCKIVFVVRDPVQVALSRYQRENYETEFNAAARENMLLDFRTRATAYVSSWRQSIEAMRQLRDGFPDSVYVLYYEDFCDRFDSQVRQLLAFLQIDWHEDVAHWFELPHHDDNGALLRDLKYIDRNVQRSGRTAVPVEWASDLEAAMETITSLAGAWQQRQL